MSLKKNVIANYLGQGWTALMGIAFVPLYIKYLGIESYGLIGVFAILQAWLSLLDMGMTPTLTREMARYTAGAHTSQSIWDLVRSMEFVCVALAMFIAIGIWLFAPWLATHWLRAEKLPLDVVAQAISIMAFVVALRFIESLYRGAILGLQQQVWLSLVGSGLATLRGVGAVGVLTWVAPNIQTFFLWQAAVSLLTLLIVIVFVYRRLPLLTDKAKFSFIQLKGVWRFAGGMMATTLLGLLLMQVDKVILSRMLNLEMFGYYTLAGTVAAALYQLTGPITQAYYPRLITLQTKGGSDEVAGVYHQGAQLISVLIVPAAMMLIFFGNPLLFLWSGNQILADNTALLLALLAAGTLLNGLMHMPYMLTLACGWPGFAVRMNVIAVAILVPAVLWVAPRYGAIGAAWIWVVLNAGYVIFGMHYLHRHILKSEKWRWYGQDVALPFIAAAFTTGFIRWVTPDKVSGFGLLSELLLASIMTFAVTISMTSLVRDQLIKNLKIISSPLFLKKK